MENKHVMSTNIKALKISALLIGVYFIFEIAVAMYSGSLSLLADAGHELSTFIAISISIAALWLAGKKPNPKRTFGYLKAETLAALFNGLLLLVMAVFIIIRGVDRLQNPMEVSPLPMLIMAIGGIGLEIGSLVIMYRGQKESLNIKGSFWHVVNAFLGSLAVIIAAIFIQFWQIYSADAWAGIIFSFILTYAAYGIIKESSIILLDSTPKDINLSKLENELTNIPGVVSIHHFHARTISGHFREFSGHLIVRELKQSEEILTRAKQILDSKYKFSLSTLQLENIKLAEANLRELEYKQ